MASPGWLPWPFRAARPGRVPPDRDASPSPHTASPPPLPLPPPMGPTAEAPSASPPSTELSPDAWRVEVHRAPGRDDPAGSAALAALAELGLTGVRAVRTGRGYLLPPGYSAEEVASIAQGLLADPVVDRARIAAPGEPLEAPEGCHRICVLPRPGVMDPVAQTVADLLVRTGHGTADGPPEVSSYRAYELEGQLAPDDLELAATRLFANETVEVVRIDRQDLPYGVRLAEAPRGRTEVPILEASDAELERVSREGVLSLTLEEMQAIREHYRGLGREPSACELETLAQTWSEHCKHKTLTGIIDYEEAGAAPERIDNLLKSTIARATRDLDRPWCVSVFEDNAGIVAFDRGWDVCIKVETHNHPSAIDPYGGAGTGIGGVIRDVLGAGLGAKPIASTDCFFVGPPDLPRESVPQGHPPSAPDPARGRGRRTRLRQPHGHPHGQRRGLVRRALRRQPAGLLRHRRPAAPRRGPQGGAARATLVRGHRRPHRAGRHPRRHVLLGRAPLRGVRGPSTASRGADRQSRSQEKKRPGRPPAGPGPRPLPRHHRLRRRRLQLRHRRDGREDRRPDVHLELAPAQVRGPLLPRRSGSPRAPGAHGPGGPARRTCDALLALSAPRRTWRPSVLGDLHRRPALLDGPLRRGAAMLAELDDGVSSTTEPRAKVRRGRRSGSAPDPRRHPGCPPCDGNATRKVLEILLRAPNVARARSGSSGSTTTRCSADRW